MRFYLPVLFTLIGITSISSFCKAQTFNASGGSIPDNGPVVTFPITVSGLSPATIDGTFGLETVCINATHTWDADLSIRLQAPDGTIINLALNCGGDGDNFTGTCFNQGAATSVYAGSAPFTGTYRPAGIMGNVNNGQDGNGTWNLLVQDTYSADTGSLIDVSLTFGSSPAAPFVFDSSNLPIVIIHTNGNTIVDDPKVQVRMGIISNGLGLMNHTNDPWNDYNGWAGIEYRGSSSGGFPQKSYGFETWDTLGSRVDTSILGMGQEHDWILYAPYDDKSLMRNVLTYDLCRAMGQYASNTRFCELVIDGQYQGVYVMMEKIKRDNDRVDIAKLTAADTTGDALTGGYIIKIDKTTGTWGGGWTSPFPPDSGDGSQTILVQYEYPKGSAIQPQQETYIQGYIDSFETALASSTFADTSIGYRHFADMNSFVDYFIINEASRNVDGYRLSAYFHKDKDSKGGKLVAGPAWDFNLAWWNADYCKGYADTGWAFRFGKDCPGDGYQVPFWYGRMLQDTNFCNALKCRWEDLRSTILSNTHLFNYIDSTAYMLDAAQTRHYIAWPILGVYTWPNPSPLATSYDGEITNMKNWIADRMIWLDANMPGTCWPTPPPAGIAVSSADQQGVSIYPNPFHDHLNVDFRSPENADVTMELFSATGQKVFSYTARASKGNNHFTLNPGLKKLPTGMYLLHATGNGISFSQRIMYSEPAP